jgi:HSP20 family molecular chaperone IbpA
LALHQRIISRPGAGRRATEPLAPLTTTCRSCRVAGAFLLFVLLMLPRVSASDPSPAPASAALTASISATPDAVRLRIQASGDVEPGSVEVRFTGRKAVVLARDAEGRAIRSQRLRLPAPVVEEEAAADYDADGTLVVTLRKQATTQDAGPPGDPEAAAR